MTVRRLLPCQTADPAKGSFYVNAKPVKDSSGQTKRNRGLPVWHGSNHVWQGKNSLVFDPHPEAHEFVTLRMQR